MPVSSPDQNLYAYVREGSLEKLSNHPRQLRRCGLLAHHTSHRKSLHRVQHRLPVAREYCWHLQVHQLLLLTRLPLLRRNHLGFPVDFRLWSTESISQESVLNTHVQFLET